MAGFGSSLGGAEGFVKGFLCEMVLIIVPRGLIFPLKSTHCLTRTRVLLAASLGPLGRVPSTPVGCGCFGGACSAAAGLQ